MPEISRRATLGILGVGAIAAAGAAGVRIGLQGSTTGVVPGAGPDNPTRAENRLPGSGDWRIGAAETIGADDLTGQIAGYTATTSVNLGGTIDFHVSTRPTAAYTVSIYRLGDYGGAGARHLIDSPRLPGVAQPGPVTDRASGMISCAWAPSWRLTVPRTWTSGSYLAAFTTENGHRSLTPFVVRDDARRADFLVVLPFSTYQAYNQWPLNGTVGKSLYYGYGHGGPSGPVVDDGSAAKTDPHGVPVDYTTRARTVSFDRPYSNVGLPQRADLDYEFVQWAERSGYDIAYASSTDLHDGRIDPSRYAALVFSGHDEYWSATMRDTVTAAVANGRHLAYIAANNMYWHVRFPTAGKAAAAAESRHMICYKTDPDPEPDASGPTTLWRSIGSGGKHAEQQLLGVQYNGIPVAEVPLVVSTPGHWFWQGTGVRDGDTVPGIVGGEVDGLDHHVPGPSGVEQVILSASPFHGLGEHGTKIQHTSLYQTPQGALVFAAATFNWSFGLNRPGYADPRIQRATVNLFTRLRQRPSGQRPSST